MKKAQVAMEYIMLLGVFFILFIVIFYYTTTESIKRVQLNEAESTVTSIAKTADYLYALGPGSQDIIEIRMPGNVQSITFDNNEVNLKLTIYGSTADVFSETKANLTGSIPISSGIQHVVLKVLDSGVVQVGS
jgi:uncharacterized protein (UPF0333 family)